MSSWGEQLAAASDEVLADIKGKWRQMSGGPSMLDSLKGFAAAVDWTEPWIIALVSFHVVLFLAVVTLRRKYWVQSGAFFGGMALIYNAERLNSLGAARWRSFARQPYFDAHGVFISAMLSAPMLLVMFAVLVNYLLASASLLVEMKRKELVVKARVRRREEQAAAAAEQQGVSGQPAGGSATTQRRPHAAAKKAQ